MKGQAVFVWIFGMVAIFSIIVVYYIFVPIVHVDIGDFIINESVKVTNRNQVVNVINNVKNAFPLALLVLVVGIIIYMVAAMQKEEAHEDVI